MLTNQNFSTDPLHPSSVGRSVWLKPPQVCKARYPNNAPKEIVAAVHGPRCGCHVGTLPEALGGQEGGKVLDFQMLPGCFFENLEIPEMNSMLDVRGCFWGSALFFLEEL